MNSESKFIHVSVHGDDQGAGTVDKPLRHIATAAGIAQPGDTVVVHEGLYRESIHPPRGGLSDRQRITYQAAEGEAVEIRGSEVITGWVRVQSTVWRSSVPNRCFGDFNPYSDLIRGDWFKDCGRPHHSGAVYLDGHWLIESPSREALSPGQWYAEVGPGETTFWVDFGSVDPNLATIEINVRQSIFYPLQTGCNYITVRGFTLRHAATNWSPPTAEQVALIGTHWSQGWIIEDNTISHSRCAGLSLGKHGDAHDNTSADSAIGYLATVKRAQSRGWHRENIGSHIVRNNHISHCEQAGIVGSLGAIFSEITGNHIHHIHVQRLFDGEEQAGIKLHAPIDTRIENNRIHHCFRGLWMDWMMQGTRIRRNLCYANAEEDLFAEVNHGPFTVDHNIFLSKVSIKNWSQGGAYVHNLLGGEIRSTAEPNRETPWHPAHDTKITGLAAIRGGDDRFINNWIYDSSGLERSCQIKRDALVGDWKIDPATGVFTVYPQASDTFPSQNEGNVVLNRRPELVEQDGHLQLLVEVPEYTADSCGAVSSEQLGLSAIAQLPYLDCSGAAFDFMSDYFGHSRSKETRIAGPFAEAAASVRLDEISKDSRRPL